MHSWIFMIGLTLVVSWVNYDHTEPTQSQNSVEYEKCTQCKTVNAIESGQYASDVVLDKKNNRKDTQPNTIDLVTAKPVPELPKKKSIETNRNEEEEEVKTASKSEERERKKSIEKNGGIKEYIFQYAAKYNQNGQFLLAVAKCESSLNPKAVNEGYYSGGGHPSGLFQYLPDTWERYKNKLGKPHYNIWNPKHQAEVTAYAFSIGGSGEWACANKLR